MNEEKKRKSRKIILLGLLVILATIGMGTLARYTSSQSGTGSATAANFVNDILTIDSSNLPTQPGESIIIKFQVSNKKEGHLSEVAQEYQLMIETQKNLPYIFELQKGTGTSFQLDGNKYSTGKYALGLTEQTDEWSLKVTWNASETDGDKYANELDYVRIRARMQQKME